ncbi:MAG: glucosaminidase domain-containing protein [Saprospiraceae bacterium]
MKKAFYCFIFIFLITDVASAERTTVQEYVDYYRDIAISEMYRTGIPASIKLGQGILESDSGNSKLSKGSNNHFGIKCKKEWTGSTYYHEDDDFDKNGNLLKSCFRVYYSSYASYIDHSEFLSHRSRYAFLFTYHHTDYRQWAHGLKAAGYATATDYADNLISVIERYGLAKYDTYPNPYDVKPVNVTHTFEEGEELAVFGDSEEPILEEVEVEPFEIVETYKEDVSEKEALIDEKPIVLFPEQGKAYFQINNIVAVSSTGKKLDEIAKETEVKLSKLLKYNELKSTTNLVDNQYLFLTKKQKTFVGTSTEHKVQEGENMYIIAQRYGLQLKHLYKMNRMKKGQQPAVGEMLQLSEKAEKSPKLTT